MPPADPRRLLLDIFSTAVAAVNGRDCVRRGLERQHGVGDFTGDVALIAIGKAACAMARGAADVLADQVTQALIVTRQGHEQPLPWPVLTAGHPLPDSGSLDAGHRLLEFIDGLPREQTVLILLSGGASSLVEVLPDTISLAQLRRLNEWFLASGIDIVTGNEIRKRISLIKGGRLARILKPRITRCQIISDVPGDDPRSIGSGLLSPPRDLPLPANLPRWVRSLVDPGVPPDRDTYDHITIEIIASVSVAMEAAAQAARARGVAACVHTPLITGDATTTGRALADVLRRSGPDRVHIWGGETTVRLPERPGRGGRCQSLALAAATVLDGVARTCLLAAGTDGSDGPGDDAGALVDFDTLKRGGMNGYNAPDFLNRADAGSFLASTGDLITTGPTGTNVMDLVIGVKIENWQKG